METESASVLTYRRSESIEQLATAMAAAQGIIEGAAKDSANPYFKSKYADLASIWEAVRKPLSANGLAVLQLPSADGPRVTITTLLTHSSGQWVESALTVTAKEDAPQAVGSAITYLRRYALQSITGVAPEDDDGEGAEGRRPGQQRPDRADRTPRPQIPQDDLAQRRIAEEKAKLDAQRQEAPAEPVDGKAPAPTVKREDFRTVRAKFLKWGSAGEADYNRIVQKHGAEPGKLYPPTAKKAQAAMMELLAELDQLSGLDAPDPGITDDDLPPILQGAKE